MLTTMSFPWQLVVLANQHQTEKYADHAAHFSCRSSSTQIQHTGRRPQLIERSTLQHTRDAHQLAASVGFLDLPVDQARPSQLWDESTACSHPALRWPGSA